MLSICLVLILQMSVKLSLFMVGTIPVVIVLIAIFGTRIRKLTRKAQDNLAATQVVVDESLQSIVSVKAFRNEAFEIARYEKNLGEYLRTEARLVPAREETNLLASELMRLVNDVDRLAARIARLQQRRSRP
jgi:ATP-binding cassette subfamily B protein